MAKQYCHVVHELTDSNHTADGCRGLRIVSSQAFYPIPRKDWKVIFNLNLEPKVFSYLWGKVRGSYAVHLWNHESSREEIHDRAEDQQLMSKLAKENCPHTYKTLVNRRKQTGAS
jgi:hypothetical protein